MAEKKWSSPEIAHESRKGLISLSVRSMLINFLKVISSLVLAKFLHPEDYGNFNILYGWVLSLVFITDIGLGDVLSQQKAEIKDEDFSFFAATRISLSIIAAVIYAIATPFIFNYYNIQIPYPTVIYFLGILVILEVLAAIPKVAIEKKLEFKKIASIDLKSAIVLYLAQITLAAVGMGTWSFFAAILLSKIVSMFLAYYHSGGVPLPAFKKSSLIKKIRKGISYQLNAIIPATSTIFVPLILKKFLTVEQIGLFYWMEGLVKMPMMVVFNYNQVFFLTLAKLQSNIEGFKNMCTKGIEQMAFILAFIFLSGALLSDWLIDLLFTEKWYGAKSYIEFVCLYLAVYSIRYLGNSVFTSIGAPEARTRNELVLAIANYLFSYVGLTYFGFHGLFYGLVSANIFSFIIMYFSLKKWVEAKLLVRYLALAFGAAASYYLKTYLVEQNLFIAWIFALSAMLFFVSCFLIDRTCYQDFKNISDKLLAKIQQRR